MQPLTIHRGPPSSFMDAITRIHEKIMNLHSSLSDRMSGSGSSSSDDDGQPHIIKIHFGNPFGGSPFGSSPFGSPFGDPFGPDSGGLGEPVMPHFLGLEPVEPLHVPGDPNDPLAP